MRTRAAFTLVELLVVIAIIGVLVGILVPTLSKARSCALQLRSQSGLRQMMVGYSMYHQENKGNLLFGYPPGTVSGMTISATDPRTGMVLDSLISDRYPWRLVKYVGNIWSIIHAHTDVPPLPESATDPNGWMKAYTLSLNPTYGINSVYVGGDRNFDGFASPGNRPNAGKHVVFKANEVRRPSGLIVFADSRAINTGQASEGLHTLMPPRANGLRWTVVNGQCKESDPITMGLPRGWFSKYVVVAFFDGHVETMLPSQLNDMRLWANRATTADYDF